LKKLPVKDKVLIALDKIDENAILSARNLAGVETVQVKDLNAYEVLDNKTIIFLKNSLKVLEETFLK
jgi:ribosomal protein L4